MILFALVSAGNLFAQSDAQVFGNDYFNPGHTQYNKTLLYCYGDRNSLLATLIKRIKKPGKVNGKQAFGLQAGEYNFVVFSR